jgi:hypothetical protein
MRSLVFISAFILLACRQGSTKQKEKGAATAIVDSISKDSDTIAPSVPLAEKISLTGTYKMKNGESSCTITIDDLAPEIKFTVFAWWGTSSGRHGEITGTGILDNNNSCEIKLAEKTECSPSVTFTATGLTAIFKNCGDEYNVPDDFSGEYKKVSSAIEKN